jgi:type II secretory pathway pseudopilin PulG
MTPGNDQRGFTYIAVLFAIAVFGVGAAAIGEAYSQTAKREREQELIEIGTRIRDAIAAYHAASPGSIAVLPRTLEDLVLDTRFVGFRRHLRRIEPDPVSRGQPWGLVYGPDGGVAGVYSVSQQRPLRTATELRPGAVRLAGDRYADWKFVFEVPR